MAIYDAGTASLAADGTVTGVGTTWRQPLTLIRVGATMIFNTTPASIVTIAEIISDTEIRVFNDKGFTAPAGTQYSILAHDGITVQGLAQDVAETLRYYQSRETEVAAAVDAFNQFDADAFQQNVTTVNNQSQQVANDAAQVSSDKATVSADKDSAAASAASAMADRDAAAASAAEAADSAASLDTSNLLRVDRSLSDLTDKALSRDNLDVYSRGQISGVDGFKYIGSCNSIEELRGIEPTFDKQKIIVSSYSESTRIGGGVFIYDQSDSSSVDDDGFTVVTSGGSRWVRDADFVSTDHYGLVPGIVTDYSQKINLALQAAKKSKHKKLVVESGVFYVKYALKVPSGVTLSGVGKFESVIRSTDDSPIIENTIQNESYVYMQFRTNYDEGIKIENLVVDGNNNARNPSRTFMDGTQGTSILFSVVRNSSISNCYIMRSLQHGIDIAAGYYFDNGNIDDNAEGGSYNIVVEDCLIENTQLDDLFTCHSSSEIFVNRCKVSNNDPDMVWGNNQHGFEVDEGSYNVTITDCYADNVISGFQQKGHTTTIPSRLVKFVRCYAKNCVTGFQIEHINTASIPSGQHHQAKSSLIDSCVADNCNNSKNTALTPRAITITGFYGVKVRDFRVINGSGNIYINGGSKFITIDGLYWSGSFGGGSNSTATGLIHVETDAGVNNYTVRDFFAEDTITVPMIRDFTDSGVQRRLSNISGYGGDATIPMIAIVPSQEDNIDNVKALGTWQTAIRDFARDNGNGNYGNSSVFQGGFITLTGNGSPNDGVVAGRPGALYIDIDNGLLYRCTAIGVNNWANP